MDWTSLEDLDPGRYPMLTSVIPFGDAMFNCWQTPRLIAELAEPSIRTALGEGTAAEIETFCRRVDKGSHLYLWFIGD